jgi:RNA polymerase sigma-70 factor (ECF subfamily)
MGLVDVGLTKPSQLRRVADWRDDGAWIAFHKRYQPLVRCCCARLLRDDSAIDDVCQEAWIEIARRMTAFVYDPGRSFRGWLWRVCQRKAIDYVRKHGTDVVLSFEERDDESLRRRLRGGGSLIGRSVFEPAADDELDPATLAVVRSGQQIHEHVKEDVKPETWEAFWLVKIMFWSLKEAAIHLDMQIAAVSAAANRVERKLREQGRKARESPPDNGSTPSRAAS